MASRHAEPDRASPGGLERPISSTDFIAHPDAAHIGGIDYVVTTDATSIVIEPKNGANLDEVVELPSDSITMSDERNYEEKSKRAARSRHAARVLDGWSIVLPSRIVKEELGDYLEDINRRAAAGQRFPVYLRLFAAMFWTGVNAVGYLLKQIGSRKTA